MSDIEVNRINNGENHSYSNIKDEIEEAKEEIEEAKAILRQFLK